MKYFLSILFFVVLCFAENPVCRNYSKDQSAINYYKCLAFSDTEFMKFYSTWPTYSNGDYYPEEGTVFFTEKITKVKLVPNRELKKSGIVYNVYEEMQYKCNNKVFSTDNGVVSINDFETTYEMHISDARYGVWYDCAYESTEKLDTIVAETEFQRYYDNMFGAFWKFYREDGTLKFKGDFENGGYCMSANGLTQTKRVTNPSYCK